jgi:hypothetical protein
MRQRGASAGFATCPRMPLGIISIGCGVTVAKSR